MIYYVTVAVCLERPPTAQEWRRYAVEARHPLEAELIATQMAACTSVMAVSTEVVGDEDYPA